jgi:putative colanic acid biosynthesis UDP-glucose lipid carrier transferase
MLLYRYLSIYRIVIFNLLIAATFLLWKESSYFNLANILCCLANIIFIGVTFYNLSKLAEVDLDRLFIGRKRTLVVLTSGIFFLIHALALVNAIIKNNLLLVDFIWSFTALAIRMFENELSAFLHSFLKRGRRVAVVGNTDTSLHIAEKLKRSKNFFYGNVYFNDEDFTGGPLSLSPYIDFAKKNQINEYYLPVTTIDPLEINTLTEQAEKHCIRINFIPKETVEAVDYRIHYISGMPVLKKYNEPLARLRNQTIKRTFDFILSSLVILFILSWLIPLVGLLIKLESRGPVFFKQERSGRDNTSFGCLKFRSMRINYESDLLQATKNDARVTRLGAFLRKTSIDELPQFINVLKGDMSIVGPRPHMLRHTEEYNELVNHYMVRLYLKPGITGWAQVNGYRGETKDVDLMKKRVEHDIWYMENWSQVLDIKIVWLTFLSMLKGHENAY